MLIYISENRLLFENNIKLKFSACFYGGKDVLMKNTTEDYLEAILILKRKNGYVRGVDIARYLNFSPSSVSRALLKLNNAGYIDYDENGMILLTDSGVKLADSVYSRHNFFKNMLVFAGVDEKTAGDEACKIEHDISDETFKKLIEAFPQF